MSRSTLIISVCASVLLLVYVVSSRQSTQPVISGSSTTCSMPEAADNEHHHLGNVVGNNKELALRDYNNYPELQLPFNISTCSKVYLDLGTNSGRQLRKLYLGLKPKSKWGRMFSKFFGNNRRSGVCAVGFEPDPNQKPMLDELERYLTVNRSARVRILRNPVWVNNDMLSFHSVYDPRNGFDGSTMSTGNRTFYNWTTKKREVPTNITTLSLRGFRLSTLLSQLAPNATVLVKLDIEGAEHRVLADIILDATICRLTFLGIEPHPHLMSDDSHELSRHPRLLGEFLTRSKRCPVWARYFDDEG